MTAAARDTLLADLTRAMRHHVNGEWEQAEAFYASLLKVAPAQPEILHAYGSLCAQRGNHIRAAECFSDACMHAPQQPKHFLSLAQLHARSDQPGQAADAYLRLLQHHPHHPQGTQELLDLCADKNHQPALIAHLRRRLKTDSHPLPVHSLLLYIFLNNYEQREDFVAALPHMQAMYAALPEKEAGFYINFVKALRACRQAAQALEIANEAIEHYPGEPQLYILRGFLKQMHGDWQGSLADYETSARLQPDNLERRYDVGLTQLLLSNMREGFDGYRTRFKVQQIQSPHLPGIAQWKGEDLGGKSLLLWAEQGIGDIVMFASLLPWIQRQCKTLALAVYPRLVPLFSRSFPGVEVIPLGDNLAAHPAARAAGFQAPMGDCMEYVLPHCTPAQHPPFLKADEKHATELRRRYLAQAKASGKQNPLLIGISWHTTNRESDFMRNISLPLWSRLFSLPNIQWISLQYGDHAEAIEEANRTAPGTLYIDPDIDAYKNTDGLCAQIKALDRVITIQNTTAHLAGALGVPTTLLLSTASNWRWGLHRQDNLWYQSVTIRRQEKIYDWKPLLARLEQELRA